MILRFLHGAPEAAVQDLREELERSGLRVMRSLETARPILAVAGKIPSTLRAELSRRAEIESIVDSPLGPGSELLLTARAMRDLPSVVDVGGVRVGGGEVIVIAGPCSVEGREEVLEVARAVKRAGAHLLLKQRRTPSHRGAGAIIVCRARGTTGGRVGDSREHP